VQAIGTGCPSLTSLSLHGCDGVTAAGEQAIHATCPRLPDFNLLYS